MRIFKEPDLREAEIRELKKNLTHILEKCAIIAPTTKGQVILHIHEGRVSKIWKNAEVE